MTPEGEVKKKIDELLRGFRVWYFAPVSNGMGKHGIHDRLCCVPVTITKDMVGRKIGLFLSVEAKAGNITEASPRQKDQAEEVEKANGLVALVNMNRLMLFELFLETLTKRKYDKSLGCPKKKSASRRRRKQ